MEDVAVRRTYLGIGEAIVTNQSMRVVTDLGSCVSLAFYHAKTGLAGICHAQLPRNEEPGRDCRASCPHPCRRDFDAENRLRYLNCATDFLISNFETRGVPLAEVDVSIFGGGQMLGDTFFRIGERNLAAARELLGERGMRVVKEDSGGVFARRVVFDTATGTCEVWRGSDRADAP